MELVRSIINNNLVDTHKVKIATPINKSQKDIYSI